MIYGGPPRAVDIDWQWIDRLEGIRERPGILREAGEHELLARRVSARLVLRCAELADTADVLLCIVLALSPLLIEVLVVELHHDHRAIRVGVSQMHRDPLQVSRFPVQRRGIVRAQRRTARVVLDVYVVNYAPESCRIVLDVVRSVLRIPLSIGQFLALPADVAVEQIHDQLEPGRLRALDEPVQEREIVPVSFALHLGPRDTETDRRSIHVTIGIDELHDPLVLSRAAPDVALCPKNGERFTVDHERAHTSDVSDRRNHHSPSTYSMTMLSRSPIHRLVVPAISPSGSSIILYTSLPPFSSHGAACGIAH